MSSSVTVHLTYEAGFSFELGCGSFSTEFIDDYHHLQVLCGSRGSKYRLFLTSCLHRKRITPWATSFPQNYFQNYKNHVVDFCKVRNLFGLPCILDLALYLIGCLCFLMGILHLLGDHNYKWYLNILILDIFKIEVSSWNGNYFIRC